MTYKYLLEEGDQGVLTLRLNRPDRKNALDFEMLTELRTALSAIGRRDARAVVLEASGNVFCAGHDFDEMLKRDERGMRELFLLCSDVMRGLRELPQPIVASVQGPAIGAGCQLALSCDLVVAAEQATFQTPGGKGGWFCHTPGVAVARALPAKRAVEMLFTGDPVPAKTALEWGMINRVVTTEVLHAEARKLADKVSQGSMYSKGLGKRLFYKQLDHDEQDAYQLATEVMATTAVSPEGRETMQAFVQKRKPEFKR